MRMRVKEPYHAAATIANNFVSEDSSFTFRVVIKCKITDFLRTGSIDDLTYDLNP
jgi:hypothetical protein